MFHICLTDVPPLITDWIQAIGSIGVAVALILQYNSNKLQRKQLQISLLPQFDISVSTAEPFFDPHILNAGIIKITTIRNHAYRVKLFILDDDTIKLEHLNMVGMYFREGDSKTKNFTYERQFDEDKVENISPFRLKITFEDSLGNQYAQIFIFIGGKIVPSAPTKVSKSPRSNSKD